MLVGMSQTKNQIVADLRKLKTALGTLRQLRQQLRLAHDKCIGKRRAAYVSMLNHNAKMIDGIADQIKMSEFRLRVWNAKNHD